MNQRLFEITMLLTQRGRATAGELAARFGVSRRTIYRDIDALSGAGVPVYAQRGKAGGICMLPDYVLDKTMFSRDEQAQLVAHFDSLAQLGTPDTQPVLDKLAALFGRGQSWLEVDFAPWDGGEEARSLFRLLRDAILQRRVVRFEYLAAPGADEAARGQRAVEPCRVFFRGQGWYLQAWCRTRQDWRFFKLNRMQKAQSTTEHFEPRPAPPPTQQPHTAAMAQVTLEIDGASGFRVLDEFRNGSIEQLPNGGYRVSLPMPVGSWLPGYLLSFGAAARVLQPEWLRNELAAEVKKLAKAYAVDDI